MRTIFTILIGILIALPSTSYANGWQGFMKGFTDAANKKHSLDRCLEQYSHQYCERQQKLEVQEQRMRLQENRLRELEAEQRSLENRMRRNGYNY